MKNNIKYYITSSVIALILIIIIGFLVFVSGNTKELRNKKINGILNEYSYSLSLSNEELKYSLNRNNYNSDEEFSNFRLLDFKNLKPIFYRGASPIDNTFNRVNFVNDLLEKNNIKYVINLSNSEVEFTTMKNKQNLSLEYINSLYENNKVYFAGLSTNYNDKEYAIDLANALMEITKNDGPFYIHCTHGRDRTGMACIIIESLAGATFEEILNDYMKSFENYNRITFKNNYEMYKKVLQSRFKNELHCILRTDKVNDYYTYDYKKAAEDYLRYGNLTDSQIDSLKKAILK